MTQPATDLSFTSKKQPKTACPKNRKNKKPTSKDNAKTTYSLGFGPESLFG